MEDQVSPLISATVADTMINMALAILLLGGIRFAYRYRMFRFIDKNGFHDPDLHAIHLRMQQEERKKFVSRTQLQLVYAIGCAAAAIALGWFAYV